MKYVIWNMATNQFWSDGNQNDPNEHWTNRFYCSKYTIEELEAIKFFLTEDPVVALPVIGGF